MSTTPDQQPTRGPDDFVPTEELVRRHGARPIASVEDLAAAQDPFGSDLEYAEFLADLYAPRRSGLARADRLLMAGRSPLEVMDAELLPGARSCSRVQS